MSEYQDSNQDEQEATPQSRGVERWLVVAVIALIGIVVVAFSYGHRQETKVQQLAAQAAAANSSVAQLQAQVAALTEKLNVPSASQPVAQLPLPTSAPSTSLSQAANQESGADTPSPSSDTAAVPVSKRKPSPARKRAVRRHPVVDTKYTQLRAQLDEQQKQLQATKDEVAKNRADLETSISSTRDDLNGSIARTHEELVTLEKRGERSYFEFDLSKSKQFQRVGPLTLSLRKADTKHKSYDLAMIVDDNEMQKKKVNLFEPVWIQSDDHLQQVQIVVNKIEKDAVHGYISAPKYKTSELANSATPVATPVSTKPPNPTQPDLR